MRECSKSIVRRLADSNFIRKYFVGEGVDIGGKPDPLALYKEFFPLLDDVQTWDWEDGDAQFLAGLDDQSLNFVHSSHCLEHLVEPVEGLRNWFRVLKENGHLIITVPDEDMYEQGVFPSTFNRDHKWTFTIAKKHSWSDRSLSLLELYHQLGPTAELLKIEKLSSTYRFKLPRFDQTLTPVGESGIEMIIRKRVGEEILNGGADRRDLRQPEKEIRVHLNQYKDDLREMKQSNIKRQPFNNDSEI
jgi:SAM-dependent methyltransferase